MTLSWHSDTSRVDWEQLSELYRIAPLGDKPAHELRLVFGNSRFTCFAHDGEHLVGAGRAVSDGLDCSYICDVAVHPGFQGQGLGKRIVRTLMDQSEGHKKIILYANPGKEAFYAKLGFKMMNTAMAIFRDEAAAMRTGFVREAPGHGTDSLRNLDAKHRRFVEERGWQPHQSPKNLVMALVGEAGELTEHFQWLSQEASRRLDAEAKQAVAKEMADVLIYLTRLAGELDIDLVAAAHEKCDENDRKYPKEEFQGEYRRPDEYKKR
jgi:NTP pyrophosphatase (non-canonical NTP hydrolase)/ribosomal protein S18 acetylase RimI-like enzyme